MLLKTMAAVCIHTRLLFAGTSTEGDAIGCVQHTFWFRCLQFNAAPIKRFPFMPMSVDGHRRTLQKLFSFAVLSVCTGIISLRIWFISGKTCVIDWKTSKKPKTNIRQTFDNPVQLAAYLGAYNSQPTLPAEVSPLEGCFL